MSHSTVDYWNVSALSPCSFFLTKSHVQSLSPLVAVQLLLKEKSRKEPSVSATRKLKLSTTRPLILMPKWTLGRGDASVAEQACIEVSTIVHCLLVSLWGWQRIRWRAFFQEDPWAGNRKAWGGGETHCSGEAAATEQASVHPSSVLLCWRENEEVIASLQC